MFVFAKKKEMNLNKTATLHKASAKKRQFLCRLSTDSKQKVQVHFLKSPRGVRMFALNSAVKVKS